LPAAASKIMPDINLIEQDHRSVKQRVAVMVGFKQFRNGAITIAGPGPMRASARDSSICAASVCMVELRPECATPVLVA
jgi:transposase-like protein